MASYTFGEFFKKMRLKTGLTLRTFSTQYGYDPANISRLERGVANPPQSREKLEGYANSLNIKKDSDDWYNFFDYAFIASGKIPPEIINDKELIKKLPLVFRTLRGDKASPENFKKLSEIIRKT
jgi:transcriptional regulator with XRE-family HTH domain